MLVHRRLRAQIVALQLPPGSPLSEKELATQFRVSRTPVREALLRLSDEGLVEIVPKSGTAVSRIPLGKLFEAIVVRRALEEVTVRAAAERATKSGLTGLTALVERQMEADQAGDTERFHAADEAFHAAIADLAGFPGIWDLVNQVKVQVDRYRRLTLPQPGRMSRVVKEHLAVLNALEKREPERAAKAMQGHLDGLGRSLGEIKRRYPDYFDDGVIPAIERPPRRHVA